MPWVAGEPSGVECDVGAWVLVMGTEDRLRGRDRHRGEQAVKLGGAIAVKLAVCWSLQRTFESPVGWQGLLVAVAVLVAGF